MSNNEVLHEKLTALNKGYGFIVFAIDEYYVQFSVEEEDTEIYFEALSHHFVNNLPAALQKNFIAMGFAIEDGNYHKKIDRNNIDHMVKEVQQVFEQLYKVDYAIPFEITDNICE